MHEENNLYSSVIKNDKHGYYELAGKYRQTIDDFYKDEYYQGDYAAYQHTEYDDLDMEHKRNFYAQKLYVWNKYSMEGSGRKQSFLDIGCGEGFALAFFDKEGWDVVGIDFSSYGLMEHNPAMMEFFLQGDFAKIIKKLQRGGRKFDFINADNVLEHLPEPISYFDIIKKVSHKETLFCVTVPNDFSLIQKLAYKNGKIDDAFWVTKETSEHFNYFSVDSLCSLGSAMGYEKIMATSDWPIDFFLLHDSTNYKKNGSVGHDCHVACTLLENSIYKDSMDKALNLFQSLADAGIGREISVYFKLK